MTDAEKKLVEFCLSYDWVKPDAAGFADVYKQNSTIEFFDEMESLKLAIFIERKHPEAMNILERAWAQREEARHGWAEAKEECLTKFGEAAFDASLRYLWATRKVG